MEERRISSGNSCILVKDKSLLDGWNSPIYKWLKDEGFISWGRKGVYSGVDWVFINLTSKMFAPGMPGISVTSVIGNHAITMDEFMTIYHIFKKYEGLDRLRMSKEDQEEWHEKQFQKRVLASVRKIVLQGKKERSALQTAHKKDTHKLLTPVALFPLICYTNGAHTTKEGE